MSDINVFLSDPAQDHIDDRLERLLLEGLDSGEPIEVTEDYLHKKRAELLKRIVESCSHR